jgi:hypothetical protein
MDTAMSDRVLLIDLENVQKVDLSLAPIEVCVMVFYGVTQRKLPEELVVQAQPLGTRLKWIKISGQGPNALDFHIAFTGFDPLIRHLQALGHVCRRVQSLKVAFPDQPCAADADHFQRLIALLRKDTARPTKRKGLAAKVKSWFPKLTEDVHQALVQRLFDESHVRELEKALTYALDNSPPVRA